MTNAQIIQEINRLPLSEKIYIIELVLKKHSAGNENTFDLAEGARALLDDYENDRELTAFTTLDGEDFMNRGEIWLINLNPTIGAEIQKTRPAVIVNDNELGILPLRVIVPLTDWKEHYVKALWHIKIETDNSNNLTKTSSADCFQIRSVAKERFVRKIGELSNEKMLEIENALSKVLNIRG